MAKTFFDLGEPYEGLKARRLKHSGRLVLYQIINDPPPYWFVQIKNFEPDGRDSGLVSEKLICSWNIANWRFLDLEGAQAKFEQLKVFFPETRRIVSAETLEKLRAYRFKPKITREIDLAGVGKSTSADTAVSNVCQANN